MELNEIISLLTNTSVTIIVIAFFMYRELKFSATLQNTLQALVDTVCELKNSIERSKD
ncbi:MAG: hypothetical protein MJ007_04835 [Paludibacteraceae bacterium]|nr:hypothetical protein [Paludibacteraceae bacterium]